MGVYIKLPAVQGYQRKCNEAEAACLGGKPKCMKTALACCNLGSKSITRYHNRGAADNDEVFSADVDGVPACTVHW